MEPRFLDSTSFIQISMTSLVIKLLENEVYAPTLLSTYHIGADGTVDFEAKSTGDIMNINSKYLTRWKTKIEEIITDYEHDVPFPEHAHLGKSRGNISNLGTCSIEKKLSGNYEKQLIKSL